VSIEYCAVKFYTRVYALMCKHKPDKVGGGSSFQGCVQGSTPRQPPPLRLVLDYPTTRTSPSDRLTRWSNGRTAMAARWVTAT